MKVSLLCGAWPSFASACGEPARSGDRVLNVTELVTLDPIGPLLVELADHRHARVFHNAARRGVHRHGLRHDPRSTQSREGNLDERPRALCREPASPNATS